MPLYEYECKACGHRFEVIQKFSDKPVKKCPQCGKGVERLVSSSAIQFKGTGWYVTDYAKRSGPSDTRSGAKSEKEPAKVTSPAASDKPAEAGQPAKPSAARPTSK